MRSERGIFDVESHIYGEEKGGGGEELNGVEDDQRSHGHDSNLQFTVNAGLTVEYHRGSSICRLLNKHHQRHTRKALLQTDTTCLLICRGSYRSSHDKIENSSGGSGGDSYDGDGRVVGRMEGSSRLIGHEANRTDDVTCSFETICSCYRARI
uniref:Uncharacterized protein n=1 Tax=Vespula pensylvanica TaxID=30213 RepID=A0A834KEU2_VESPE|nr:hypothetical protein H0235_014300 [Vespula pensylvanica]